ncbi:M14 family metallopeptidase [Pareuzebyella sediminis]|uniref:M14 family metallopeptidase n=1 Tax=Pareuzebyella sediminis TaxID=2607998 RepID=UPI0011EF6B4F|nr:M14 family metallopeptidase [Pareuzebyella sediminis]
MLKTSLLCLAFAVSFFLNAQDPQSPTEFLGYELGTRFTPHHRMVDYFQYLNQKRPQLIKLEEYGRTYEERPLIMAFVSSEENMADLEKIRREHIQSTEGLGNPNKAIVWMSYNAHGNESASTEAAMQTVYELMTEKKGYLENTVVLMDPCINPDGRDRYVNWYNQFGNNETTIDPNSKEHHEPWLNGRPNHYMFDLNRDWAWLTQQESQQRIVLYNKWLPHVHVDFHEQGVNSPYYFAPAAEPFHEVITDFQRDFQMTVGKNHAKYFDSNGWFYFTKEIYDLLYPSYGDTFPTYNGAIGMTYEQGGSGRAGLGITTNNGDTLTLKDRVTHHIATGLSTLEVCANNVERLNSEFKKYYKNKDYLYKSYVLKGKRDYLERLAELLQQHEIEFGIGKNTTVKGYDYGKGTSGSIRANDNSLVVSTQQKKGTLVKVLFEPNAKLTDSLTYDITAWSLPYAYGLEAIASETPVANTRTSAQEFIRSRQERMPETSNDNAAYAFLSDWDSMKDAQFLADLLQSEIQVRFAKKPFSMDGKQYNRGSLIIARADNKNNVEFIKQLRAVAKKHGKHITPTATGFVEGGKDFGSASVQFINKVKVAVLSGVPTSTLHFGEIWHFFEQQLHYPLTIIDSDYWEEIDLSDYDVLILPDGDKYTQFLDETALRALKTWVEDGGKLIAMGGALKGLIQEEGFGLTAKISETDSSTMVPVYDETVRQQINKAITGAIFRTKVDTTHPLAFGYKDTYYSLKLGHTAYNYLDEGTVVYLEKENTKPVAGFAGTTARKRIADTLIFGVEAHGKGHVVYMVDNPLFRGFWENGKLFFANALFLVD